MQVSLAALIFASAVSQSPSCTTLFEEAESVEFEQLLTRLPVIEAKSEYESLVEYQARLAASNSGLQSDPLLLRSKWIPGIYYDAEKGALIVHASAFGHGEIRFDQVLGERFTNPKIDYRSGAIGFQVAVLASEASTYTAQNGYGASFEIKKTEEHLAAIFESPGDPKKSVFVGAKRFEPIAEIVMDGARAQDIVENGGYAIAFVPKAPFYSKGIAQLPPSARYRRHIESTVSVIHADVRCAYVLDGKGETVASFEVK